jgi:hypothetical protein
MGATVRGSTTTLNTSAGDAPDEGDSSGRSRARWALILAGLLIVSGSMGMAAAQTVPVASPIEDVTETVDDVIVEVKDEVSDKTKSVTGKVTKKARRAVRKSERVTHEAVAEIKQTVAGDEHTSETRVATQAQAKNKKKNKKPSRERKRRDTTAQEDDQGEKNEDGDVNTLVDAGNEIEGTRVRSAQVAPEPESRQESLPLTGFDPRALALIGFGLISAGLLLLATRDRTLPVAGA